MSDRRKMSIVFIFALIVSFVYLFYNLNSSNAAYLIYRRLPRLIAMYAVAGAITVSTSLFQTTVNNKILTPDLLGYSQLYVLLQTVLIFTFGSLSIASSNTYINFISLALLMIIFSLVIFTYVLKRSNHNLYLLLLVGTILNTLFASISSFLQMVIDPNEFAVLQNSIIASFNNINTDIIWISIILLLLPIPWLIKNLNNFDTLLLGKDYANSLGVDTKLLSTQTLVVISILISVSTSLVGPITFLGMLVINVSRLSIKSFKHKESILFAILVSINLVVGVQFIIEKVFTYSITLSVLLNLIGGIYMIYLMMKERNI